MLWHAKLVVHARDAKVSSFLLIARHPAVLAVLRSFKLCPFESFHIMVLFHDKVSYFLLPRTGSGVMKLMQNCLKHGCNGCRDGQLILGSFLD